MPSQRPAPVFVRTPGKVNLHLGVGELRPDGFHDLVTVFHAVELHDLVIARPGTGTSLEVAGPHSDGVPDDGRNLAWRAATLLAEAARVAPDVHLGLQKRIPVAGGMAGGSADAAGALVACSRAWRVEADLQLLAGQLGSDVPFALIGGTALGTGRGEVLRPLRTTSVLHWVFAFADFGIAAAEAYRELDRLRAAGAAPAPLGTPEALIAALAAGDVDGIAAGLANDLEPAALSLQPSLRATLDAGLSAGALAGVVSGSGPTCAFLCADGTAAEQVGDVLRGAGRRVAVTSGPAPGAEQV